MADVHSREVRSFNMSRIKGKNTKPELLVRKFLYSNGFRYRLNVAKLPGKPDIVLTSLKSVIFVHGCFWHGHKNCKYFVVPKTRTEWWLNKIQKNKVSDATASLNLRADGWRVIVIYECELRKDKKDTTLLNLLQILKKIKEEKAPGHQERNEQKRL